MKSLYSPQTLQEIESRIGKLTAESKPVWGKMNSAQMLEHCARGLDLATGRANPPRALIGRLIGSFMKKKFYNDSPWAKNIPTDPSFLVSEFQEFEQAKNRLLTLAKEFSEGGETKCSRHPNPFFGKLTPAQQGLGQYKHLNHHLEQFGV